MLIHDVEIVLNGHQVKVILINLFIGNIFKIMMTAETLGESEKHLKEENRVACTSNQVEGTSLKAKLIKMKLKLKDCENKIPILKKALQETEESQEQMYNEKEKEFSEQLAYQAKINCGKLSTLLQESDRIIEMKTRLTLESYELLERIKVCLFHIFYFRSISNFLIPPILKPQISETEMTAAAKTMHSHFLSNCNDARLRWEQGKLEREKLAIDLKTRDIQNMTAHGLEPQIKHIQITYNAERKKMELEAQERMDRIRLDFEREYEDKIAIARNHWEVKKQEVLFEKKKQWGHRLDLLSQQHDQELFETRKQWKQDLDAQRKWQQQELQAMKETQRSGMTARRIAVTRHLQEENKKWEEEKANVLEQTKAEIHSLDVLESENKAVWEATLKTELDNDFQRFVEEVASTIEKQRDATLDGIIRRQVRDKLEREMEETPTQTMVALNQSLAKAQKRLEDVKRQVCSTKKEHTAFADQKLQLEAKLIEQQRQLKSMQQIVCELLAQEEEMEREKRMVEQKLKDESQAKVVRLEMQKSEIQREIDRVHQKINEDER
jgi:hypothetical protein